VFFLGVRSSIPSNRFGALLIDHNQNLWVGAYDEFDDFIIAKFDGTSWVVWNSTSTPLPKNHINSMVVDNENDIWLLNKDLYLPYTTHYLFEFTNETNWIQHATIEAFPGRRKLLFNDDDKTIWIGDMFGLYRYSNDSLNLIVNPYTLSNEIYVTDIKKDSSDNIWYPTGEGMWGRLYKYDQLVFTPSEFKAVSIEIDSDGNVWVGTIMFILPPIEIPSMLLKYNGSYWTIFDPSNSPLPATFRINDLAFDKYGNLWICTEDKGIAVFNENGIVTSVEPENIRVKEPKKFSLFQNYPNPFNPITSLQYAISSRQFVTLKVYDLLGREAATLVNEEKPVGEYEVEFDGSALTSGIYFYQLKAGEFSETKKMVLLR
jgi:ligand-binding sensor domain-containing protein